MNKQRSDDFTHDGLGFMPLVEVRGLVAVARFRLDLNDLACQELADRGLDHRGKWVGFPKAREIYERTRDARPRSRRQGGAR